MSDDPFKGFRITSDPDVTSIEQPGQDPARQAPKLPLRLLLASDLTPQAGEIDWSGPSRVERVDTNSFGELMQAWAPRLNLEVPNKISATPKLLDVALQFPNLDAFHPVQVAAQVPALQQLLQIRTLVSQVDSGAIDLPAFRDRLAGTGVDADWAAQLYETLSAKPSSDPARPSAGAPSGRVSDDTLDRLLGLVSTDGTMPEQKPTPTSDADEGASAGLLGALVDAVAGQAEAKPKVEKTAAGALLADLDSILSEQLNAILGHDDLRRLEAAWRGLKFLVSRLPFRQNVQLSVLATSKADLNAALYYQVLLPEHNLDPDEAPLTAIILDHAFDNSAADIEQLEDLAETGASLQAPLIAAAEAAFFGVNTYQGMAALPPLWQHVERPEYIAWNKLREKKESRYLVLAVPAFLLRASYGGKHSAGAFDFTEDGALWGNASLAVAVRIADSFAQTGWPTHVVGSGSERRIEDLPLRKSKQGHTPLAVLLPNDKLSEFAKGGFVVLSGATNQDMMYVARAVTVCKPEAYEDLMAATEARIHVTLPCQLFVARAAHHLLSIQQTITPSADGEQARSEVEARLRAFFHTEGQRVPPDAVEVTLVDDSGVPDQELLAIRLRTPSYVLDRPVSLVMGLPVPKAADA